MIIFQILSIFNIVFSILFMLLYSYQVFYIVVSLVKKPVKYKESARTHRYAFLISARNEEGVIGQLCDSIRAQDYPSELMDIYVVADNCTDNTATVAAEHGAIVTQRFDKEKIGKGYALDYLLHFIDGSVGYDNYDAYIVVDADNLLEPDYLTEMDKCFSEGNRLIVGYRNSKNYGDNWISAGYSLWFLRASRQLNNPRTILGTSCEINGTGFLMHKDIVKRQDGWIHHLLIEDIEFTVDNVLRGEKVVYCHDAMFYDEQPTSFKQSWWQRQRWCRGYLQILGGYSGKLIKSFLTGKGFSNYDMLMAIAPAFFLTVFAMFVNALALVVVPFVDVSCFVPTLISVLVTLVSACVLFFFVGLVTLITEWKNIRGVSTARKLWSAVTFPLFMATYVPIAASALFKKVEWKQIEHHAVTDMGELISNAKQTHDNAEDESPKDQFAMK